MPSCRVLIDGYFLGKPYGFGRFIFELCRALGSAPAGIAFFVAVPSRVDLASLPTYPNVTWHTLRDANFVIWEQILIPRLAHRLNCGVVHFPYNTRALFTGGLRTVTTVHDLIFLEESIPLRQFKPWFVAQYAKRVFGVATGRSDAVVSVSDTTRQALSACGIRATTVYNTVDGFLAELAAEREAPAKRYVLHRGGYQPHRNTERVIQAFRNARSSLPDTELRIVGAPDGAALWGTKGDGTIRFLPRLSDAELAACYADSACVVAASLQEGFGLPIIEGFGFGAPVITSDLDPMREVAGDAAFLVDPFDIGALKDAIVTVMTNPSVAQSMVRKGRARQAAFSSQRVAEAMVRIYSASGTVQES